jgi:single-stranded DNA-binding protein
MSFALLVQGTIAFGDPQQKVSRTGNNFVFFKMKGASGNDSHVVTVFVFSESGQAEALRLHEGDALAVQGTPKFEIYRPADGEPRVSLSMTADMVLALRQPPKTREKKDPAPAPARAEKPASDRDRLDRRNDGGEDRFNDSVPF